MIKEKLPPEIANAYEAQRLALESQISFFKERLTINQIIGIFGGSEAKNLSTIESYLTLLLTHLSGKNRLGIACGGTVGGLPELAITIAKKLALPTIAVYPEISRKHALSEGIDLAIETPPPIYGQITWGSETPVLISLCDTAIFIGGSAGTMIELATAIKAANVRKKLGLPPMEIVSLSFTGGVAALASSLAELSDYPLVDLKTPNDLQRFIDYNQDHG